MAIRVNNTPNCCTTYLIHGFGHAHSETIYPNFSSFARAVYAAASSPSNNYYGFTNSYQKQEREWLEKLGFKSDRVGAIYIHYAPGTTIRSTFKSFDFSEENRKAKEEREKAARERAEAIANGTLRNKDGSIPRKRGEFRVGDTVHWFADNQDRRFYNARVTDVHDDGRITLRGYASWPRHGVLENVTITPVVANGYNIPNIRRRSR